MKLSLKQCVEWMGGTLLSGHDEPVHGYSIDTRTLAHNDLFFAVSGEHHDAHRFVDKAIVQGAAAAVVSRAKLDTPEFSCLRGYKCVLVDDPLLALQRLSAAARAHWPGTLIGLTGSAGKTTTKEMVAAVLSAKHKVLKSDANLNNHFGVPLQLLRLEPRHRYAVIEMGMSNPGEIALLARLAAPVWAVVTNVGAAHAQNFPTGLDGIALAKRELIDALPPAGLAFLNADDPRVAAFAAHHSGRTLLAGLAAHADVRATEIEQRGADGLTLQVHSAHQQATVHLNFLGAHNAGNALLALAVGLQAGVPLQAGVAALAQLTPGDKRGQLLHLRGAQLLNDCYNSNPAALSAMIQTLMQLPAKRHIVIAGEMLELGPQSPAMHAACGQQAAHSGADFIIGVQGEARALTDAAAQAGAPALFFETPAEAGAWLTRELREGDAVLLKASRGVRLERALEPLQ